MKLMLKIVPTTFSMIQSITNFDPDRIKIDENSYKNILIY